MEDASLKQTTMVSRLPKFGSRAPSVAGPLPNGSALASSSNWAKVVPLGKQNGAIPVLSSLSEKGKKEGGEGKVPILGEESRGVQRLLRPAGTAKQNGKISSGTVPKVHPSKPTAIGTFPRTVSQSTRANPRTVAPKHKPAVNGVASGRSSSSSESLKSLSVETVVRSQSFSYLKSPATTADPPLIRSFSFNRAAELAKELPRPLSESPVARSPVAQPALALNGGRGAASVSSLPTLAFKKSLLPSCSGNKTLVPGYKLVCPSLIKQPRPIRPSKVQAKAEVTDSESGESASFSKPSSNTVSAETVPEDPPREEIPNGGASLELLEDMSLSSTSSLEHNDGSEEYMDDFDDLGNVGGILLMPVRQGQNHHLGFCEDIDGFVGQRQEGSSVSSLHSFTSETVDWAELDFAGGRKAVSLGGRESRALSEGKDLPHGSSLDLSPSDSSGGTYMWDEEVLEPLGRGAQLCRSYDSNLNSMDILNNLEHLDSCDLEDDDLMLDADLPEDASLRSDVESEFWHWRKRQQRVRKERLHEHDGDGVQDYETGSTPFSSGQTYLDNLILKHMAQDCSSVKDQLLQLRRLLQPEEEDVEESVSSPSDEEQSYQQQVEELLKEVQMLREELRLKDKLIARLTQHLSPPLALTQCQCQQGDLEGALKIREQQNKSTQTPWRGQNPQILQPSRASASALRKLARPSIQAFSGAPSDHVDTQPGGCPVTSRSCTLTLPLSATDNVAIPPSVPSCPEPVTAATLPSRALTPDELYLLINSRLKTDEPPSSDARLGTGGPRGLYSDHPGSLRVPQRPGILTKPLSLEKGTPGASRLQPGSNAPSRTSYLPPPKRGFPCIGSAPQVIPSAPQSRGIGANSENGSVRAQNVGQPCGSRLPKPKSH